MERLMQYVWQHRLCPSTGLTTVDGRSVRIIDPGLLNTDAGPDFFNAKVMIDGRMWAGNVEIHVRASDWHRHRHDADPAYSSVILHVVDRDDAQIVRPDGQVIPQMRMPCAPDLAEHYAAITGRADIDLPCAAVISGGRISRLHLTDWLSTLAFERIYAKTERIEELLRRFGGDWEQTCYVTLARALGFGKNAEPFERLALSLPLQFVGKHSDNPAAVEALLFGQAGLLPGGLDADPYAQRLRREYDFLTHKFGLRAPADLGWKMGRMRPANLPHRRVAMLAAMLGGGFRMLARVLSISSLDAAMEVFTPVLPPYWQSRYTFGAPSQRLTSTLSRSSVSLLVINVAVPLMMAYGQSHSDHAMTDRAVSLLQSLDAERNAVTELFGRAGLTPRDAFESQALVQLRRAYCEQRKCLYCRIGHRLLSSRALRPD